MLHLRPLLRTVSTSSRGEVSVVVRRLEALERQLQSKSVDAAFASLHRLHELGGT